MRARARAGAVASVLLPLVACSGSSGSEPVGTLEMPDVRGFPDPAQAVPPPCLLGENCTGIVTNGTFYALAPNADGSMWASVGCQDGAYSDGESCTVGSLTLPNRGDAIYGDGYIALIDAGLEADLLVPMGDAYVMQGGLQALPDGDVIVAGSFYPTLVLGEQSTTVGYGMADFFLARLSREGTWKWVQTFPYGNNWLSISAVAWRSGELWLTGLYTGTPTLGGTVVTPNTPVTGMLYVARMDPDSGSLNRFETLGTAIPAGFLMADDGAVFLSGTGSYQYGGQLYDHPMPYPESFVARLDEGHTWQAYVTHYHAVNVGGSVPLDVGDGHLLMTYYWNTATSFVTDGLLIFGSAAILPMNIWQDGAKAVLDRSTGKWVSAYTSPYTDTWTGFVQSRDDRIWGLEVIKGEDNLGQTVTLSAGLCQFLATGATVSCQNDALYRATGLLASSPDGALWLVSPGGETTTPDLYRLEL